jgi:signal transduction histidine kinase
MQTLMNDAPARLLKNSRRPLFIPAWDIPESLPRLPKELERTRFCVVPEALSNRHRHARARGAAISLGHAADRVTLVIRDNGVGRSLPARQQSGDPLLGMSISGMRERVMQLGGEFPIERSFGSGARIQVVLPLTQKEGIQ